MIPEKPQFRVIDQAKTIKSIASIKYTYRINPISLVNKTKPLWQRSVVIAINHKPRKQSSIAYQLIFPFSQTSTNRLLHKAMETAARPLRDAVRTHSE